MTFASFMFSKFSLAQYGEFFLRVLVACVCGGIIGYERSKRFKEAGIRTHIIVCCASAMIMIISKYGFADLEGFEGAEGFFAGTHTTDPARLAAQIVTGISFLGAGVIFHNGNAVKGLTTAAGIWATAGIGMAVGAGMYPLGLFVTLVISLIQLLMHKIEIGNDAVYTSQLRFTVKNTSEFRQAFNDYIEEKNGKVLESKIKFDEDGYASYNLTIRTDKEITIEELDFFLESNSEVKSVSCVSMS